MKTILLISIFSILLSIVDCRNPEKNAGIVTFIKGKTLLNRSNKEHTLKNGDILIEGDVVATEKDAIVVISFNNQLGEIELQENSILSIDSILGKKKSLNLKQGNAWTKITKLPKSHDFQLMTPVTVAGVRGTKFYTFQAGEYFGVCHCEGEIQLELKGPKYNAINKEDILVVGKGDKSVVLTATDLKVNNLPQDERHRHSKLDNSPVGKKNEMSPEQLKKFFEIIDAKFKSLEK